MRRRASNSDAAWSALHAPTGESLEHSPVSRKHWAACLSSPTSLNATQRSSKPIDDGEVAWAKLHAPTAEGLNPTPVGRYIGKLDSARPRRSMRRSARKNQFMAAQQRGQYVPRADG
jgi:hypothetical protein